MYRYSIYIAIVLFGCMMAFGCKKDGKDDTEVTFVNNISKPVTLDIYSNADDYANGANVYLRKTLLPNENTILPGSSFKAGQIYYMDWYTDDYFYTNWFNDTYPVPEGKVAIRPVAGNNTYYAKLDLQGNNRIAFLNKTATSTKWRAVGAYTEGTTYISHWTDLSAAEQYREVTVNKNFTAAYSYKNASGDVVTDNLAFMVHNSLAPYIEFIGTDGKTQGSMTGGRLPTDAAPDYASASTDSVMALLPNSDLYFLMVRE